MAIIILERTMLYLALLQGEILNISQTGIYSATYYFFGCQVFALKLCALLLSQEIKAGNYIFQTPLYSRFCRILYFDLNLKMGCSPIII